VTVATSAEQALSRPLKALTAKKYVVLGARSVTVAVGDDENVERSYEQDPNEPEELLP
jgi:hypothetical protein